MLRFIYKTSRTLYPVSVIASLLGELIAIAAIGVIRDKREVAVQE